MSKTKRCSVSEFDDLVVWYGNAAFDCARYEGKDALKYKTLVEKLENTKQKVIAAFEGRKNVQKANQ